MSKIIDGLTTLVVFVVSISFVWNESASLVMADRAGFSVLFGLVALFIVSSVYSNDKCSQSNASVLASDESTANVDSFNATVLDSPEDQDLSNLTLPELFAKADEIKVASEVEPVQEPQVESLVEESVKPVLEVVQEPVATDSRIVDLQSVETQTKLKRTRKAKEINEATEPKATKTAAKARKTSAKTTVKEETDKPKSSRSTKTTATKSTSAKRRTKAKSEATDKE